MRLNFYGCSIQEAGMKILAIMGSPRKGDSYSVTRQVERRMRELGPVEFEYVFLKDMNIQPCRGCFLCTSQGEEYCPIQDDCPTILEKMMGADGVIFASPVYALSITGLMKNFKDRLAYNAHRPRFFGKFALAIVTSAGTGLEGTLQYLESFSIWGFEVVRGLALIQYPSLKPTPTFEKKTAEKISGAAERFYGSIQSKKQSSPSLARVLQFRVLKLNTLIAGDYWEADREYYQDRSTYYYDTSIALPKKLAAWLFEKFFMAYMRKNYILPGE
jgi:multimeric flavodoxin WrbA